MRLKLEVTIHPLVGHMQLHGVSRRERRERVLRYGVSRVGVGSERLVYDRNWRTYIEERLQPAARSPGDRQFYSPSFGWLFVIIEGCSCRLCDALPLGRDP